VSAKINSHFGKVPFPSVTALVELQTFIRILPAFPITPSYF